MRPRLLAWPPGAAYDETEVTLDASQSRHGLKVLRLSEGDEVTLASPWGLAPAVVVAADRRREVLTLKIVGEFTAESAWGPTLALPLIRPSRFDWAVEKAVELGARELWPLTPGRGRSQSPGEAKPARWLRLAEEARKQCARAVPMVVGPVLGWAGFVDRAREFAGPKLLMDPQGREWPLLEEEPLILIGPEGGFSDLEKADLSELGFWPVALGPRILRTETAALAALAQWA
ncbi:MAG: 16S rRNA (uracil(1498)-N(3))-methyltransferase, partial [Deltaproteobacteria bacterium]|nr:16S rRNA (uracil(1498)-N(3))-methyltransferase [Deltaproteobacteria bacterium]